MKFTYGAVLATTLLATALPLFAQSDSTTSQTSTYTFTAVSRSTQSVNYRKGGSTKVDMNGTDLMPEAKGVAKVETRTGRMQIDLSLEGERPVKSFGLEYLTYVLWAITPEGRPRNLAEVVVKDGRSDIKTTTDLQAFALIVTAEPYFAVTQPSDIVVVQNLVRRDTKGLIDTVDVKFEAVPRRIYISQVAPIEQPVYDVDTKTPSDLLQARNALRIAKDAGAERYASDTYAKARQLLDTAEDYYRRKQGKGPIGTTARGAAQTAEEARVITIRKEQEERAERERQDAAKRTADAEADARAHRAEAEAQQAAAAAAQAQAAQAQAQAAAAAQQSQQAEADRAAADRARMQAEAAQKQAEDARQQAENDRSQMRARLLQQLNQVLETKDSARGLIVSMPDVLFDTGKAELKPSTRERLARVSGILLAYPDIKVEIDGHTDSTGSPEFNEQLSQHRADAVRSYLSQNGVNDASMTTHGFGPTQPVASNDTAAGRQQNRRVELIVSGQSIGTVDQPPSQ